MLKINRHTFAQKLDIYNYIKEHYTTSKLYDNQFAEKATQDLKFPVHSRNILSIRTEMNIPPNKPRRLIESKDVKTIISRLEELEYTVAELLKKYPV